MSWWGKVVGGAFGFMLGGPLGALLGGVLGHQFDRGLNLQKQLGGPSRPGEQERVQMAFFTALFSTMGYVAKADGRVSEDEIAMARGVMHQMRLDEQQKRAAIELFNQGKQPDFDLDAVLEQFRQETRRRRTLLQMFLEVLTHAAYADGVMHPREQNVLRHIAQRLGFSAAQFEQLLGMVQAQRQFHQQHTGAGAGRGPSGRPTADQLKQAYELLGVSEEASDAEIKKAYRRQMNQHHPDKLVSRGMPEEMIKMANEKAQEIKEAHELIKKSRES
ncbi:co-chaperone DjlA [Thiohalophilus thiocyanatoxydans]|uniref:Co-chaperone protein DjlA n=1 Tax=Thiohalophilus thiocyanatoxydans TaxID=381308 RepID=A0A4R8IUC1_9GAMM|nr:co-chaperone DjlA [Thiohalophilus thiocyanatoxydans]TDY04248.1 DnaJ like chaperone protein [Thiohalophilus thiocyanatoxydans]